MSDIDPYAMLAADAVGGLSPYQPGMPPEVLEREYGIKNAIKLASNENPAAVPVSVNKAMQAVLEDVSRYPDGGGFALREALAKHLGVNADQLTLGNGSNDVLVLLAETFLNEQTAAVYDQHSFVVYRLVVQATGARALIAASNPTDHAQPLGHDLDAMRALVDETTRLVFIANPNNPTGTWVTGGALHAFLISLPAHVIVVVDEAYFEYAVGDDYPDTLSWLDEFPNLVLVRTFSKAYGLAAARVGYGISAPGVAELLNRVRQPFNVNSMAQAGAIAALKEQAWVAKSKLANTAGLHRLRQALERLGINSLPSRGNFLLAHIGPDAAECNEYLLRDGVIVRPVVNYGLSEYLRITVGTEVELDRLLVSMHRYRASIANKNL
ncbi:MAG: histidinol-phosphate transaminase [Gammaproteobacteria bacterium]|nr:histidinol-phosphate transaminase [Gammaproteobacteria bacterium]MCP4090869.1 histidinol-phosphate transaminase [Gammaproteobacteria bacterium]MCP4275523.1 histidinol-phosphate transaminase [Gammaproteobacteria bacterium]MCP4832245.1 histidinol-phosphate transaminase [Gammaproteobacteria bacterium]MCP4930299.1 histidinol-phosphate transaminase [Gammaproteobacteria bacterium]